ncbi:hypothetical protein BC826DRAFT_1105981 [Russula brevipes]|nr:hypothetical protein BC826DRAFT_1105981 [Russula brevipes]
MAIEEAAHVQPVRAEPGLRWGHPETLDADVHAQVMGIDLDTLSGHPEEPEAGTHAQTIGAEPDPLLASAESEDLLGAWDDWLVEVEEVEVEAADENARVEEGTDPLVDPQAFGAMRLAIPSKVEPVPRVISHACYLEEGKPAVFPS